MITYDWDTPAQCKTFDEYLEHTVGFENRTKIHQGYGYQECEWNAFQHGWNAAKHQFRVEEND